MTQRDAVAQDLSALFERDRNAGNVLARRTAVVDGSVSSAFATAFSPLVADLVSLAAVGGYGRKELFPYSDVDLLILIGTDSDAALLKDSLSTFLSSLWDKGLRISHSTRSIAECCRFHPDNLELHISLLDLRYVAGSSSIYSELQARLPDTYARHASEIIKRLTQQARQRHARFSKTPYHLEPNVKEAPGGIRDIHLLCWLAQVQPEERFYRAAMASLEGEDPRAKEWLFSVRCFLHLRAGRDSNLLTFEMQDEAARSLPPQPQSPEECMRIYFRHARQIYQHTQRAIEFSAVHKGSRLKHFLDRKRRNWAGPFGTPEFAIARNRVYLRKPQDYFHSSSELMRLFTWIGKHGMRLSWDARWSLQQAGDTIFQTFRLATGVWAEWRELLSQPHAGLAFSEMQETGVLASVIPQWSSIDNLVVRDFYHRYTVDEHTLVAIREIDNLLSAPPVQAERFAQLVREDGPSPELRLAILLHDVGKGTSPGDHMRGSRQIALEVMASMKVPDASQKLVLFLIRHHLDLSILMNGRDLEDPATGRLLTAEINTVEDLRRLTLLTFADISAVNPTAMSPWRLEQLWRVYLLGVQQLTRELASDRIHEPTADLPEGASSRLLEFLEGFPKRYLRTHSREQIEYHLQLSSRAQRNGVEVEITEGPGAYLMTVLAHDKSGLFAALCGALASFGMNIVKGEASSNSSHFVLDEIRFTDPNRTLALNPEEVERLEGTVRDVVAGSVDVAQLLKRRRPVRRPTSESTILPSVRFVAEASEEATLIDFVGEDRPGLLYDLATAIRAAECNIEVVMIDTEAHKAIDVFYVTRHGSKLDEETQLQLRASLLKAADSENNRGIP